MHPGLLKYKLSSCCSSYLEVRAGAERTALATQLCDFYVVVKAFVGWLAGVFGLCWALTSLQVTWQSGPFPSQLLTQKALPL